MTIQVVNAPLINLGETRNVELRGEWFRRDQGTRVIFMFALAEPFIFDETESEYFDLADDRVIYGDDNNSVVAFLSESLTYNLGSRVDVTPSTTVR